MQFEPMIIALTSDIAGKTRGKAFPAQQFDKRLKQGIGWTPTNVQITCFDLIADSPYGALGDLVLIPDPATLVELEGDDERRAERFVIGDLLEMDGRPWACCTRSILKAALDRLDKRTGLQLYGAFEHEFHFTDAGGRQGRAYTASGFRAERPFGEALFASLIEAGLKPDTFMKEYGVDQYEVTIGPATGVAIADHAVILRELVQITAERLGRHASFTPLRHQDGVGNGVHVHLSFRDRDGQPAIYDPQGKHGLNETAQRFVAGILAFLDRIVAITAPSVVSYKRLTPHRWSAAYNNLGLHDREASVRICPLSALSDVPKEAQFNLEFRAGDAAASPYLMLAAIVHAGLQGIEDGLICPEATEEDLSLLPAAERERRGILRLPQSLEQALQAFSSDETVRGWFPPAFSEVYLKHKRGEISVLDGKDDAEICAAYQAVY